MFDVGQQLFAVPGLLPDMLESIRLLTDPATVRILQAETADRASDPPTLVSLCTKAGSSSISVQTLALQRHHPCAKQVNAGTAIHAPLERLQPVDLSLRLTIAPGFQHGIANGLDVLP